MKVRIHNNTLRIRVTQSEVTRLAAGERVEQTTFFSPTAKLVSAIEPAAGAANIHVTFDSNRLILSVPTNRISRWANSSEVGIEADQVIDRSRSLQILMEKDFQCLHGEAADNEDAFPNPLARRR